MVCYEDAFTIKGHYHMQLSQLVESSLGMNICIVVETWRQLKLKQKVKVVKL